jgi:hypothetical protein
MAQTLKTRRPRLVEYTQGKTTGKVEKKLTGATDIKGHHVAATPEHPEYLVKSDKSGKPAAHRAQGLKKR